MTEKQMLRAWMREVLLYRRKQIDGRGPLVTFAEKNLKCHFHSCLDDANALLMFSIMLNVDPVLEVAC